MRLDGWPEDLRLICRRERPHPGAQLTLFDIHAGFRHTCFITATTDDDITALELRHRGHARVEDRVRDWKACGLANLPFDGFCRNQAWVAVSVIAGSLLAWSQMACFDGQLAKAEPKTMRHRVLHVAAVLVRRQRHLVLRLDESWPWASELAAAFIRLRPRSHSEPGPGARPRSDFAGRGNTTRGERRCSVTPPVRSVTARTWGVLALSAPRPEPHE